MTTNYLVDTNNHTGYAQVVEELQSASVTKQFTFGYDLISQRIIGGPLSFYSYDGHGSVRQLTDASASVTDTYTYDAFGILITRTGTTPNDYLYSGEQFDANLGFYYLRARLADPSRGRFLTMDSFEGSQFEPKTLHKYSYAEGNPISNIDPAGEMAITMNELFTAFAVATVLTTIAILQVARPFPRPESRPRPDLRLVSNPEPSPIIFKHPIPELEDVGRRRLNVEVFAFGNRTRPRDP